MNPTYLLALIEQSEARARNARMLTMVTTALDNLRKGALKAARTPGLLRADRAFLRKLARS